MHCYARVLAVRGKRLKRRESSAFTMAPGPKFGDLADFHRGLLALLCVVLPSCQSNKDAANVKRESSDQPFVFVYRITPYSAQNEPASGIVAAVWENRKIVRTVNYDTVGRQYVTGTLLPEELDQLRKIISTIDVDRLFEPALDAGVDVIAIREEDRVVFYKHSPHHQPSAQLLKINDVLMNMKISDQQPIAPAEYTDFPKKWGLNGI